MINIFQKTAPEINMELAKRLAGIRKRRKISQKELARKSGVSFGSLKRFEQTGDISLISLTKLSIALGIENELEDLFTEVPFNSIQEVINAQDK